MLHFQLKARREGPNGSVASAKQVALVLDTALAGRPDALNPVELLLAAQAACFIKGIERLAPTLNFQFDEVSVTLEATRPEDEAKLDQISYRIEVSTPEPDHRLELLHKNLMRQGTIYNTIKSGTNLSGVVVRAATENKES